MKIEVYSDGSATTADKEGGWGAVVLVNGNLYKEFSGHLVSATNNDAELWAAIQGLEGVIEYLCTFQGSEGPEFEVTLISDSEIILNWANGKYKFKQIDKLPLYDALRRLVKKLRVKTQWVRGHSGNIWNERCDKLANDARKGIPIKDLDSANPKVDTRIGTKKRGTASVWFKDRLMVLDFETGIIEPYNREVHGKRGSFLEIREEKNR